MPTSELAADHGVDDDVSVPAKQFDFRRPSNFSREHVRSLQNTHEVFLRRFASGLGATLRTLVQLEPLSVEQVSYDDYARSLPNPNVLGVIELPGLPGSGVLELNVQFALQLVDRLLGGRGVPVDLRRPTELEAFLLRDILQHGVSALAETLAPALEAPPTLTALEFNPQLVQVAAPSDMVVLLSYRLSVAQGAAPEGLLTLCYPASTMMGILEAVTGHSLDEGDGPLQDSASAQTVGAALAEVDVVLSARLVDSPVAASDLAGLRVGDVLRLDHRSDQRVLGRVGATDVLLGSIGRRGRRLALQVDSWITPAISFERAAAPSFAPDDHRTFP